MSAWFSVKHGGPLRANKLFQLIFLAPFIGFRVSSSPLVLQIEIISLEPVKRTWEEEEAVEYEKGERSS